MIADWKTLSLLNGPTFRRWGLSMSAIATFTLNSDLTQDILDATTAFWKNQGIDLDQKLKAPNGEQMLGLKGEGGTLWSFHFAKYKKIVGVSFRYNGVTNVAVRIDLPGAYAVQSEDTRDASQILADFEKKLTS